MYKCTCLIIDNVHIGSKRLIVVRPLSYNLLLSDSGDRHVEKAGNAIKKEKQKHFQWCKNLQRQKVLQACLKMFRFLDN